MILVDGFFNGSEIKTGNGFFLPAVWHMWQQKSTWRRNTCNLVTPDSLGRRCFLSQFTFTYSWPPYSGSVYYNCKKSFSLSRWPWSMQIIGSGWSTSGTMVGLVVGESLLDQCWKTVTLNVPGHVAIPGAEYPGNMPFTVIGHAGSPLKTHLMRPYPGHGILRERRIFNYRLSHPSIQRRTYLHSKNRWMPLCWQPSFCTTCSTQTHRGSEMAWGAGREPAVGRGQEGRQQRWAGSICCEGQAVPIFQFTTRTCAMAGTYGAVDRNVKSEHLMLSWTQ